MPNTKPKVSVNKLGEYMTASYTRKKTIVNDQKNPPAFKAVRYAEAREAYIQYIISGFDKSIIGNTINALSAKPTTSDFQISDKETSLEALNCCDNIAFPNITNLTIQPFSGNGKIEISGVDVSVFPDLILRGTIKGKKVVGAIKFHIIKRATLNEEARKSIATTLHQFIDEKVREADEIAPFDYTFSIDIFSGRSEIAPKSFKRRRSEIQVACEEYALWWAKI